MDPIKHGKSVHSNERVGRNKEKVVCSRRAYTDFRAVSEDEFISKHLSELVKSKRKTAGGVLVPFPEKLHDMLSKNNEFQVDPSIVSWLPHGRAFKIHKPQKFQNEVLPRVYKHTQLNSFLRQINLYGFYRINFGPDQGAYYHELFLRGKKYLAKGVIRTKVNGRRNIGTKDPNEEPNFYTMPFIADEEQSNKDNTIFSAFGDAFQDEQVFDEIPEDFSYTLAEHHAHSVHGSDNAPRRSFDSRLFVEYNTNNSSRSWPQPHVIPDLSNFSHGLLHNQEHIISTMSPRSVVNLGSQGSWENTYDDVVNTTKIPYLPFNQSCVSEDDDISVDFSLEMFEPIPLECPLGALAGSNGPPRQSDVDLDDLYQTVSFALCGRQS